MIIHYIQITSFIGTGRRAAPEQLLEHLAWKENLFLHFFFACLSLVWLNRSADTAAPNSNTFCRGPKCLWAERVPGKSCTWFIWFIWHAEVGTTALHQCQRGLEAVTQFFEDTAQCVQGGCTWAIFSGVYFVVKEDKEWRSLSKSWHKPAHSGEQQMAHML